MKNSNQTRVFTETVDEPCPLNLRSFIVASLVQFFKLSTHTYTVYARVVWLKQRQKTRLPLLDLTDEQLRDIGINRAEAEKEGNKFFWE